VAPFLAVDRKAELTLRQAILLSPGSPTDRPEVDLHSNNQEIIGSG
jgi:hypothetical protein